MTSTSSKPSKRLVFVLVTVSFGVIVSFVLLEIAARVLDLGPGGLPMRRVEILDGDEYRPAAVWGTAPVKRVSPFAPAVKTGEYIPGLTFRFVYSSNPRGYFDEDNGVVNRINSHGLRGPEFETEKAPGTFRILGLGDSFTFGAGVRIEDTFLARLENLLTAPGADTRYQVINCGVASYNTADEVTYLEHRWMALDPDLVLITFVLNDAYDDAVFGPLHRGYVEGVTRLVQSRQLYGSRFLAWAYDSYLRIRVGSQTEKVYLSQFTDTPMIAGHNWGDCRRMFARAREITRRQGCRLALVIFPELHQLSGGYPFESLHEMARSEAESLGIPVLDLLDVFRGRKAEELWVHPTDHHPNEIGHRLAADAIHDFLLNNDLLQ